MAGTHTPQPERSVRPADLDSDERDAVAGAGRSKRRGEFPLLVVSALLLAFLVKTFLVQAFYIPSGSMIPTLEIDDRVLVEKVSYRFRMPERGEVIVFRRPGAPRPEASLGDSVRTFFEGFGLLRPRHDIDLIKRVVGLPGETVEVRDGRVYVDGLALEEPYAHVDVFDHPATVVPAGHLFMMGDNRPNSDDSRGSLGTVPVDHVVGRAFVIMWPPVHVDATLDADYPLAGEG